MITPAEAEGLLITIGQQGKRIRELEQEVIRLHQETTKLKVEAKKSDDEPEA